MNVHFTRDEEAEILRALRSGLRRPLCPRCETTMGRREVPPRKGVAYVRERVWLICGGCGRSLVVDRRKIERRDPDAPG